MQSEFVVISQGVWRQEELFKSEIAKAAKLGFFYLEMPDDCRPLVKEIWDFAKFWFSTGTKSTNYHSGGGNIQREQAHFLQEEWHLLPEKVLELSQKTSRICIEILKIVYSLTEFSECEYERISGGAISGIGTTALTFNNYQVRKQKKGLGEHQDFGQISLLFIDKLGLQVQLQDKWLDVAPMTDHAVIIFGQTLEVLINDKSQLIAAKHRVTQCFEDRLSIALFTHNRNETPILQRIGNEIIVYRNTSKEFLAECLANTLAFK